jgi:hypothetical protein
VATSSTTSKSQPKPEGNGSKPKATGKAKPKASSKAKAASKRTTYDDRTKQIATKARATACPASLQGPVPKQVADIMRVLEDPRKVLKEAGLTQKQLKAYAQGNGDKEVRAALRPLGQRVVAAGGAKQWVSGRPLAATLVAWLEQK